MHYVELTTDGITRVYTCDSYFDDVVLVDLIGNRAENVRIVKAG